jgi:hypothetical protein
MAEALVVVNVDVQIGAANIVAKDSRSSLDATDNDAAADGDAFRCEKCVCRDASKKSSIVPNG